jgi:hypothetical protein
VHIGTYISGAGHIGLIGWLFFGGPLPEPEPFEVRTVSTISSADFDALLEAQKGLDGVTEVAQPVQPEVAVDVPEVAAQPDEVPEQPAVEAVETPAEDTPPEISQIVPPPPVEAPDQPDEPVGDVAVLTPDVAEDAAPEQIDRVAPDPVAPPDPEAQIDPVEQTAIAPDAEATAPEQEQQQDATAPEAAVPEVVTEATNAPAASARPPGRRPAAPAPQPTAQPAETETDTVNNDDVLQALAAAQDEPATPSGPPLSSGERDALRVAVSNCWNVGSLSSEALRTTVIVAVSMNQDGTPISGSIELISSSGGSQTAARQAFEAARRAIIRCGAGGYDLPTEKYDHWQDIEMTFNPESMRVR